MSPEPYQVELSPAGQRQLADLPPEEQARLGLAIKPLATDLRPPGSKKLKGQAHTFRLRVGKYRIVYDVYDRVL
jgi:mRNA interferase RelE/StbE